MKAARPILLCAGLAAAGCAPDSSLVATEPPHVALPQGFPPNDWVPTPSPTPETFRVFVVEQGPDRVTILDATGGIVATTPVGADPNRILVDPVAGKAFVANYTSGTLTVLDVDDGSATGVITLPNPDHAWPQRMALDAAARRLYVTGFANRLFVVDADTGAVLSTVSLGSAELNANGVAVHPATGRTYVANVGSFGTGTVAVVEGEAVVATIMVGDNPHGLAIDPPANRLYVLNGGSDSVSVIDTATNAVTATIPVGDNPIEAALHTATGRLYVSNNDSDTVSIIDTATGVTLSTVAVGDEPQGVVLDPPGETAWIANYLDGSVTVIGPDGTTTTLDLDPASQPIGIALIP